MMNHTPGPWEIVMDDLDRLQIDDGKQWIAMVIDNPFDEENTAANARLIAAAPELLNALEDCKSWVGEWYTQNQDPGAGMLLDDINNAIIKAKGEGQKEIE